MPANYVLLERIELNASAASVTFSNIPQTGYTDLKVVMSVRNTGDFNTVGLVLNGVSTNQTARRISGNGSTASSSTYTEVQNNPSGSTANTFSNGELYLPNYTSSNNKSISIDVVSENNATLAYANLEAWLWSQTAAITSVGFTGLYGGSIAANSTFSLYGLAAVGTTPVIAPKASGGSIYNDGTYWYHAFRTSGAFVPLQGITADVLVIAGGGGGAGGLQAFTSQALTATSYNCTIGAGGSGGTGYGTGMTAGVDSQFGALTLVKGGGYGGSGGNVGTSTGGAGGSSGGSGYYSQTSTAPLGSQGTAGGASSTSGAAGGGGGGASVAGSKAVAPAGGAGGNGTSAYSSWGLATSTGQNSGGTYYYAGGGAGGCDTSGPVSGGLGGGGGSTQAASTAGTANTGGGGGAGSFGVSQYAGAAGGSGIIIVRYTIA